MSAAEKADIPRSRNSRPRIRRASSEMPSKRHLDLVVDYPSDAVRPVTRGDCDDVPRPCPFVSCRWNLYLDVSEKTGRIRLNFPDLEPDEMAESCVLDIADRGGADQRAVGAAMNITRQAAQQAEARAAESLRGSKTAIELGAYDWERPSQHEHLSDDGKTDSGNFNRTAMGGMERSAPLDEGELFCERVYATYERRMPPITRDNEKDGER